MFELSGSGIIFVVRLVNPQQVVNLVVPQTIKLIANIPAATILLIITETNNSKTGRVIISFQPL